MSNTRRGLPITTSRIEQIFPKLTPAQISRIAARGHIHSTVGGEVLFEQGHSAAPFFVIISGELEVVRPSVPVETLVIVYETQPVHWPGGGVSSAFVPLSQVR